MKRWIGLLATGTSLVASATTYNISADYTTCDSYPLQKTQFGASYFGVGSDSLTNVFDLLAVRNVRNNDKRLTNSFQSFDATTGDPIYDIPNVLSRLIQNSPSHRAIFNTNVQGPYEHTESVKYRVTGTTHNDNEWNWDKFGKDTERFYEALRAEFDAAPAGDGYPFVFTIGHEPNNDDTIANNPDGVAFMGPIPYFWNHVITDSAGKVLGDAIQATNFFTWYKATIDEMMDELPGGRRDFLISAPQVHTTDYLTTGFLGTFHDLVDDAGWIYKPDFIGCHSRKNKRNTDLFFDDVVTPCRGIFDNQPLWLTAPVMCNEFGIFDHEDTTTEKYNGTLRGAVLSLNYFERMLTCPDVAFANFIINEKMASSDGQYLYAPFHAFRFYQHMPQSRTKLTGTYPSDIHVLSSRAVHSVQSALIWRDENVTGNHTVNFTFANANSVWTKAKAHLYVISGNIDTKLSVDRTNIDSYGPTPYKVTGYPKTLNSFSGSYTFSNIVLPPGAIALLTLERLDANDDPYSDTALVNDGPVNAQYVKSWQWTARNGAGGVDPSWGYFDTKNWTLFAGIDSIAGSDGSATASYLTDPDTKVKRGMAGVEFVANAGNILRFKVNVETGGMNPTTRDYDSIGAIRVDFYNGTTKQYDAAVIFAGNRCPTKTQYSEDYVPWGYGGNDTTITPQEHVLDRIYNGNEFTINLDSKYKTLTGKTDASDFTAGGRKVIVSAWVENVKGGIVVRLSD